MNKISSLDTTDCIDMITANLDQAEGILSALEVTLSTSDIHHHKLPHAVTAAMGFIGESRGLITALGQAKDNREAQEEESAQQRAI